VTDHPTADVTGLVVEMRDAGWTRGRTLNLRVGDYTGPYVRLARADDSSPVVLALDSAAPDYEARMQAARTALASTNDKEDR
jgi:hypothetical protein